MGIVIFAGTFTQARLAQSVEHQTFNLRVAGSSPSSGDENFEIEIVTKMTLIKHGVELYVFPWRYRAFRIDKNWENR